MIAVVQRVIEARVVVEEKVVGEIGHGLLVLAAVESDDTAEQLQWMANKLVGLRIFRSPSEPEKHFDLDVQQVGGGVLLVSNFTVAAETRKASTDHSDGDPPCFISPSRYELTVGGRKIVGSAQRRLRRGFLQHGSMPIACDREMLARATRMTGSAVLYEEMAGLAEFLPTRPLMQELVDALVIGFQTRFMVEFRPESRLTRLSPDVIKIRHGADGHY